MNSNENLKVQAAWVHLLTGQIRSEVWRGLSGSAAKIYITIRAQVDLKNGISNVSQNRISGLTGLSEATVERKVKELLLVGLVEVKKRGTKNTYALRDTLICEDGEGNPHSKIVLPYVPLDFQKTISAIKEAVAGGDPTTLNLTLNLAVGNVAIAGNQNNLKAEAVALLAEFGEEEIRRKVREKYGVPPSKLSNPLVVAELLVEEEE